jgi:histidyl-tRNA synthetase
METKTSAGGGSASGGKKLSLEPYKGTRDFYPEDQFAQNYIFSVWRKVAESYGYSEYGASILEETDLYRAKSGEEIVNEQTYSFTDRGGRDVTIRPEMTPTVARMVAQKRRELSFPLRWYSIPNLFRYERPQRGRLREHWQLNCDMFGVDSIDADVEMISLAYDMMRSFGAKDENFEIKINSRKFLNFVFLKHFKYSESETKRVMRVLEKVGEDIFKQKLHGEGFERAFEELMEVVNIRDIEKLPSWAKNDQSCNELKEAQAKLKNSGISNVVFDFSISRGFDYYTGTVFEMYDTNPKNPRALFGGGRYDDLVGIFGVEKVSGIGFGWGDVTTRDFLETYNLLPAYHPPVQLYIAHLEGFIEQANQLASDLRKQGVNVEVDLTDRQVSKQVKTADKEKIPFVVVVGEEEVKSGKFKVKSLKESKESVVEKDDMVKFLREI